MLNIKKIKNWLLQFIHVQLVVSLVSLPILIAWGLPISIMSPISNLIFTPLLMAFLCIASLLFFTELICLPNELFVYLLEQVTSLWSYIINLGTSSWLIGFAVPHPVFSCALLATTFGIIHLTYTTLIQRICLLTLLMLSAIAYLKFSTQTPALVSSLAFGKGELTLIHTATQTALVDPGIFKTSSAQSFIEYTLPGHLYKNCGHATLDHVLVTQPSIMTFQAITQLCKSTHVQNLYVPFWEGKSTPGLLRSYGALRHALEDGGGKLIRITNKTQHILLNEKIALTIVATQKKIKRGTISFAHVTHQLHQYS